MEKLIFFTPKNINKVADEIRAAFANMHDLKAALLAYSSEEGETS